MTNLTTEEMQRIVDGAPKGATLRIKGMYLQQVNDKSFPDWKFWYEGNTCRWESVYKFSISDMKDPHNISDLRKILAQQQEIERLREALKEIA